MLKIAVSYSGGPDSGALLRIITNMYLEGRTDKPEIIYFNHNLRGNESSEESRFVAEQAERYGLRLNSVDLDVKGFCKENGLTTEEGARILRYRHLDTLSGKYGAVALGHNADDRAETVFFNFLRGSGIEGLSGIPAVRGMYIRPLSGVRKEEILEYCEKENISYFTDSSNIWADFTRNLIRNSIFPYIERKLGRKITNPILRLADSIEEISELIVFSAEEFLWADAKVFDDFVILNMKKYLGLRPALKRAVFNQCFRKLGSLYNPDSRSYTRFRDMLDKNYPRPEIIDGVRTGTHYNSIILANDNKRMRIAELSLSSVGTSRHFVDPALLKGTIRVCTAERQMIFRPFGSRKEKKLSEIMGKKKVPVIFRDVMPCLKDDKGVFYIHGIGISDDRKVLNGKEKKYITADNDILNELY